MMDFYNDHFGSPMHPLFDNGSGIDPEDPFKGCLITLAILFAFFIVVLLIALFA